MSETKYRRKEWPMVAIIGLSPGKHGNARNSSSDLWPVFYISDNLPDGYRPRVPATDLLASSRHSPESNQFRLLLSVQPPTRSALGNLEYNQHNVAFCFVYCVSSSSDNHVNID